jgi:hypothetical protein
MTYPRLGTPPFTAAGLSCGAFAWNQTTTNENRNPVREHKQKLRFRAQHRPLDQCPCVCKT